MSALPAAVRAVLLQHGIEPAAPLGPGVVAPAWSALGPDGSRYAVVHAEGPLAAQVRARAVSLSRLDHPALARCTDVFPLPDGVVALVEAAPGTELSVLLEARGRLDPGEVVAVLAPVAEALDVLHRAGLTHGHLSPVTIVMTQGRPVLVGVLTCAAGSAAGPGGAVPDAGDPAHDEAADLAALCRVGEALLGAAGEHDRAGPQTRAVREVCARRSAPGAERITAAGLARELRAACPEVPLAPVDPAVLARLGLRRLSGGASAGAPPATARATQTVPRPAGPRPRPGPAVRRRLIGALGVLLLVGGAAVAAVGFGAVRGGETATEAAVRLSRQHAAALVSADRSGLAAVTVPGSPAARADEALVSGEEGSEAVDWDLEVTAEGEVACGDGSAGQVCVQVRTVTVRDGVAGTGRRVVLVLEPGPWRVAEVRSAR
ncbi:hypothetical protein [Actinotalea sp.]|uniref:hypothetical protein n=1 Tax=Actinotalea sp. TaxID=1872145 RepID=UPI0035669112